MSTVIRADGLIKTFGKVRALDGLDLSVSAGEVHGFLGPNGAGKSTTIRILLGLARPTGGTATVFDRNPWDDAVALHRRIAYVPGDVSLWQNLSGGEAIDLIGRLRSGPRGGHGAHGVAGFTANKKRLSEVFQFDPTKKGRTYSKGNRQKVALIAAFATEADLYIFDEPTSGLDPLMVAVFEREIRRVVAAGATVLLSSHVLSEVEQLCDRVTIIRAGATAETGTLSELRHLTRTEIAFADSGRSEAELATIPGAHDLRAINGRVSFTADSTELAPVLSSLATLRVQGLTVNPASLEELFLRHYGQDAASADTSPSSLGPTPAEDPTSAARK